MGIENFHEATHEEGQVSVCSVYELNVVVGSLLCVAYFDLVDLPGLDEKCFLIQNYRNLQFNFILELIKCAR